MVFSGIGGSIIGLIALVVAILTIVHVWTKNTQDTQGMKIVWTVLAIIFSIITGIVYYVVRVHK